MKIFKSFSVVFACVLVACEGGNCSAADAPAFWSWAEKPPMGWNSWDCFATTVTEAQTRAQADVMAGKLKPFGWEYIVVDIQWYEPNARGFDYRKGAVLVMDDFGRLLPATNRFSSAANGAGFKALADYVHGKGLKFGIHLMRGIPRQAVRDNAPVKGTSFHAQDIANTNSVCTWNTDMFGVDMTKPGAQEYYNSVFDLIASWDVDFVKVDDLSRPYTRNRPEVEAIRKAIDGTGRPMVLSLSPGETPVGEGDHVTRHANQWRISDDFWDKWSELLEQFRRCDNWARFCGPGHFPDADMLPLGVLEMGKRRTRFTPDEQITLMTLWSIVRSPLIMGGDLTKLDDFTLSLLTNAEIIAVNQNSSGSRQLFNRDGFIGWVADVPGAPDKYLALFNTRNPLPEASGAEISVPFGELGLPGECMVRDLWGRTNIGRISDGLSRKLPWHGAGLYRISAGESSRPKGSAGQFKFHFDSGKTEPGWTAMSTATTYDAANCAGFEPGANIRPGSGCITSDRPFLFSVKLPEGNYRVSVTFGDAAGESDNTVKSELRRLMLQDVKTTKGQTITREFTVNIRTPAIPDGGKVRLKPRERESEMANWDDKLTLEFNGARPCLRSLEISPAPDTPTIFLLGDSTVCDQPREPWNSWGQMLPRFFKPGIAVANHAQSGESIKSSLGARRCDKVFSQMKAGDWLFVQFGHNDMKDRATNALAVYRANLKKIIAQTRAKGATPVLITSMERKNGIERDTLESYPKTVREVAKEEDVALIDLHAMSKVLYKALGANLDKAFQDGTHHNNYGSYELARCVVEGIRQNKLGLTQFLVDDITLFDPAHPDPLEQFNMPASPVSSSAKPDGS